MLFPLSISACVTVWLRDGSLTVTPVSVWLPVFWTPMV
jgi:hypothetical protein